MIVVAATAGTKSSQPRPADEPTEFGELGHRIEGIAIAYDKAFSAVHQVTGERRRLIFRRRCCHQSMALGQPIVARIGHEGKVFASTKSGTLFLDETDDGLFATIWPHRTVAGRRAVHGIRYGRLAAFSIGGQRGHCGESATGLIEVHEFALSEIALVSRADACCKFTTVELKTSDELAAERAAQLARGKAEHVSYLAGVQAEYKRGRYRG